MRVRGAILAISAPEDLSLSVTIRGELAIERGHRATKLYSAGPGEPKPSMQSRACISDRPPATSMSR
jgi:hypothetical protein